MIGYHQCSEISIRKGLRLYNFTMIFEPKHTHTHTHVYVYTQCVCVYTLRIRNFCEQKNEENKKIYIFREYY